MDTTSIDDDATTWALVPIDEGVLAHRALQTWTAEAEVACAPGQRIACHAFAWHRRGIEGVRAASPSRRIIECESCRR